MNTRVVHVRSEEWAATPEELRCYIGRAMPRQGFSASIWANPFHVQTGYPPERVVAQYEAYLLAQPDLLARLPELRGKVLGCWCVTEKQPDAPCHGAVLARLADEGVPGG